MENGGGILITQKKKKKNLKIDCQNKKGVGACGKGLGLRKERARGSWERGSCGYLKVVLTFWIFFVLLVNFICCYGF